MQTARSPQEHVGPKAQGSEGESEGMDSDARRPTEACV